MTNIGPEKHPNNEEDLPVVLLHGTSGHSEDWSQVVAQLMRHRPVIRLNYAEPVAGTDSANAPRVSDFADRVVAAMAGDFGQIARYVLAFFRSRISTCGQGIKMLAEVFQS